MAIIATVVGLVVLAIRKLTNKKLSPKCNCIIWMIFIIALIFPVSIPSRISIYNFIEINNIKDMSKSETKNMLNLSNKLNTNEFEKENIYIQINDLDNSSFKLTKNYLLTAIAYIWFVISLLCLIGRIGFYLILINSVRKFEYRDEKVHRVLERCKKKLKIKRNIRIIKQNSIKVPSIMGVFNIKILLTDVMFVIDEDMLEDILMHELSHYKRKDNILNVIISYAKSIYWFNPIILKLLSNVRSDMEYATDQLAISKIEDREELEYCKSILIAARICSPKYDEVLGVISTKEVLDKRTDMVFRRDDFEKNSRAIISFTVIAILLIGLLLYPTSYGMFADSEICFKLADGTKVNIEKLENNNYENIKTINVKQGEKIKLFTQSKIFRDYITFYKLDLETSEYCFELTDKENVSKISSEVGEYIYEFIIDYENGESANYAVKIIVE